ncbi:MAG: hypothetical protein AAGF79_03865 [Pseudomonadota bacterium]
MGSTQPSGSGTSGAEGQASWISGRDPDQIRTISNINNSVAERF